MNIILLTIHLLLTVVFKNISAQTCDPDLDCAMMLAEFSQVPDPNNCERYYLCVLGDTGATLIPSENSFRCPAGKYFRATPPNMIGCTTKTTVPFCDTNYCGTLLVNELNICQTTCPATIPSFIANSLNCSYYDICLASGNIIASQCSEPNSYFNGSSCVNDPTQCCDFNTPLCTTANQIIPDPNDCTAYYVCSSNVSPTTPEIPSNSYRKVCSAGEYFDSASSKCISGSCVTTTTTILTTASTATTSTLASTMPTTTTGAPTTTTGTPTTSSVPPTTTTKLPQVCTPVSSYACPSSEGYFPQCNYCARTYFHCFGGTPTLQYCPGSTVFNTVLSYPACIQPNICPYYP